MAVFDPRRPYPGLSDERGMERADAVLFLRMRADAARDRNDHEAAIALAEAANLLVGGEHAGCFLRDSKPPPEGWEQVYSRPQESRDG